MRLTRDGRFHFSIGSGEFIQKKEEIVDTWFETGSEKGNHTTDSPYLLGQEINGQRTWFRRVQFKKQAPIEPNVMLAITELDILHGDNHRLRVFPSDIDRDGFQINAQTWGETVVWSVGVDWLAIAVPRKLKRGIPKRP